MSVTIKTEKKFSNIKSVSTFSSESLFRLRCFIDQEYILENFSGSYVNSTVSLEIGFKVTINNKSVPHSKRFSSSFAFYRKLLTIGHVSSFSRTKNYSTYVFLIMHTNKKNRYLPLCTSSSNLLFKFFLFPSCFYLCAVNFNLSRVKNLF